MKFPVAVQLYSVRDAMEKDFEGTLKAVKAMGYDGVEFAGLFSKTPEEVKSLVNEIGLNPISAHVSYDELAANPQKVIEDYATIGCKYIAIPYAVEERRPGGERYDETVEGIKKFAEIGAEFGITILYHNHDFEFQKIDGEYLLDILYNTLPSDKLQTEIDTCWVGFAGVDPVGYVKKYKGRAPVVHLKDYVKSSDDIKKAYALIGIDDTNEMSEEEEKGFAFRPVGYGVQDIPAILSACEEAGTQWVIVEIDSPAMGKSSMECIEISIDYLKENNK